MNITRNGSEIGIVLLGAVVGVLAGILGAAFHLILDYAATGRELLRTSLELHSIPGWVVTLLLGGIAVGTAAALVGRFAPETAGSGIQEVEGVLANQRPLRWQRVLPIKFLGGFLGIGSGLVLGREGPTVHMGSALGGLVAENFRLPVHHVKTLIAAGAGAGLAAAFNAPLAGVIFITEEMRSQFNYNFASLHTVIAASCMAIVVSDWWLGQGPSMPVLTVAVAPLIESPFFLLLGVVIGAIGAAFNRATLGTVWGLGSLRQRYGIMTGAVIGAAGGLLIWFMPDTMGSGERLVESLVTEDRTLNALLLLFVVRFITTVGSYGAGVPGGIFAPMLALGTLTGIAFGTVLTGMIPEMESTPGMFAVAGMGAVFAATVGAPLTGIVLVVELTSAHQAVLTIMLTCLSATLTAKALGGRPIYSQLLELALRSSPGVTATPGQSKSPPAL
ncbi:MAG: H(+)/Cl(-) exchange transporter ClcA [Deltaproteobacteria bacterium]|nr:H(+)/Cl(-) exchange transporter ClcA [Deltaproteobacteria bacterium]